MCYIRLWKQHLTQGRAIPFMKSPTEPGRSHEHCYCCNSFILCPFSTTSIYKRDKIPNTDLITSPNASSTHLVLICVPALGWVLQGCNKINIFLHWEQLRERFNVRSAKGALKPCFARHGPYPPLRNCQSSIVAGGREVVESIHPLLILNVGFGWNLSKAGQGVQPHVAPTRMFPPEKQKLIVSGGLLVGILFPSLPCSNWVNCRNKGNKPCCSRPVPGE